MQSGVRSQAQSTGGPTVDIKYYNAQNQQYALIVLCTRQQLEFSHVFTALGWSSYQTHILHIWSAI